MRCWRTFCKLPAIRERGTRTAAAPADAAPPAARTGATVAGVWGRLCTWAGPGKEGDKNAKCGGACNVDAGDGFVVPADAAACDDADTEGGFVAAAAAADGDDAGLALGDGIVGGIKDSG